MTTVRALYGDQWGDILDRPDDGCVEIRWFDTTADMSGDDFNDFLSTYAGCIETAARSGGLVDAVQFKMDFAKMSTGWRDENIVPRYNNAGVRKFAFIVPAGAPPTQNSPAAEGPANFPTGYFGSRAESLDWLKAQVSPRYIRSVARGVGRRGASSQ